MTRVFVFVGLLVWIALPSMGFADSAKQEHREERGKAAAQAAEMEEAAEHGRGAAKSEEMKARRDAQKDIKDEYHAGVKDGAERTKGKKPWWKVWEE